MEEFWTAIGPSLGVLLLAFAGWMQQRLKIKGGEEEAAKTRETVETNKKVIRILTSEVEELKETHQAAIDDFNAKIEACEQRSSQIEKKAKEKIHDLEMKNVGLNTDLAELILELNQLTTAIKAQGVRSKPKLTNT